jgi:transcription elongation GreA/GreB family factor
MIDKSHLRAALLGQLNAELELQVRAANLARDEATNEESRADNKYDTRGQEAAYLAEGQAKLASELAESIAVYRDLAIRPTPPPAPIEIGSVVKIERQGGTIHGFMGSRSGGTEFTVANTAYTVITPASPLGKLLLGRKAGETVYLAARGKPQAHRIVDTA